MSYKLEARRTRSSVKIPMEELHRDWHPIFQRFNPDGRGEVKLSDMKRLLGIQGLHPELPEDTLDKLLQRADKDENGKISYMEFLSMVQAHSFEDLAEKPVIRGALWAASVAVVPKNERTYISQYSCIPPPLTMLTISLIELGIFIYHSLEMSKKGLGIKLEGPVPYDSYLIYNPFRRFEAWRFISYMFVHAGLMHITVNILVQTVLGISLEMVHRWWRVLIVFMSGVIAGSLATSLTDPNTFLCGSSGGAYALLSAHLASLILNWREMEFAWVRLLSLLLVAGSDVGVAVYGRYVEQKTNNIGYVAHIAGALAGVLIGINVLRNLRKEKWEKVVWWISLSLYVILMIGAITYNLISPESHFPPPATGESRRPFLKSIFYNQKYNYISILPYYLNYLLLTLMLCDNHVI